MIKKIRPWIVVETVEPREIIEGVTKLINIVLVNKGLKKAEKRITIKLGGKTLYDKTITIPGKTRIQIQIPLKQDNKSIYSQVDKTITT